MRILHILDHSIPLHSGYTFRTRAILQHQRALGWETFHLTSPKQGKVSAAVEEVDNLVFHRSPPLGGWIGAMPIVNQFALVSVLARRAREVIAEVKPDILHAHSPSLNGLAALSAARSCGLPVVYEVRAFWEDAAVDHGTSSEWGMRYRLTRASETWVLRRASAVTTICEGLRREMIEQRGIPAEKVTVIPNAVDIEAFKVREGADPALRAALGLVGKRVVGFIGSFYAYEGLELLIRSMPAVLAHDPDVRLLLVGGGPQESALKALVRELALDNCVQFTGRVPHAEVQRYYDLVDLLAYPRLKMRLTDLVTPLKPLEAMAQEKLVIASDVGGHRELIRDGENGFLFAQGSAESLARKVIEVFSSQEQWQRIRTAGRQFVERERNWAASVSRYDGVYRKLLTGHPV
ncbi:MAG: glycosyltransferase, exosortase A system-associated [Gammaproteobacteria bacterium]|nr:glycosyltransferase, exosortase A system-associated [Gammaproteobacteria bacterium]